MPKPGERPCNSPTSNWLIPISCKRSQLPKRLSMYSFLMETVLVWPSPVSSHGTVIEIFQ